MLRKLLMYKSKFYRYYYPMWYYEKLPRILENTATWCFSPFQHWNSDLTDLDHDNRFYAIIMPNGTHVFKIEPRRRFIHKFRYKWLQHLGNRKKAAINACGLFCRRNKIIGSLFHNIFKPQYARSNFNRPKMTRKPRSITFKRALRAHGFRGIIATIE